MSKNTRVIILSILAVLIVVVLSIGITTAFMKPVEQGGNLTEVSLSSCAKIKLTGTSSINLSNSYSMSRNRGLQTTPYSLTVTSYCDSYVGFNLYIATLNTNTLTDENIHINIAEGSFDILGVYFHVKNMNRENNIYIAVNDSGYMSVLKYFLGLGLVGKNIIINIFSDKDKEPWFYKKLISELKSFVGKINLYYNELSKDFGVPKNQIKTIKMG